MRAAADKLVRYSSVSNQHFFHLQRNMYLYHCNVVVLLRVLSFPLIKCCGSFFVIILMWTLVAEYGKNVKIDLYCAALWQQTHYG
ncbi:hypothetical protein T01_8366 [Trichinella spiralis]|uniref:Uncharacterized protein n=1 Tax=Trichinella spiralis TaxID=6334 RepID=A0A0V1AVN9_TRISP|nr:hypothetical protein T01_8366 [Trichinella spiralis]